MGNGIFSCKGCNEYCVGRTRVEINNNLYGNYGEMNLDKSKSQQRIITNIFIPNCKLELSPDNSIKNKNNGNPPGNNLSSFSKNTKIKGNTKDFEDSQNNFTQFCNDMFKVDKNMGSISPVFTHVTTMNQTNKTDFNNYNPEMLKYLNKIRNTPNLIIEDIENIINNNIKVVNDKQYIVCENTNEMINLNMDLEKLKEILKWEESMDPLKLNNKLKINHFLDNIELTDKKMKELLKDKKREIIDDYPKCFFCPIFIKDIKTSFITLLSNSQIKEKIFSYEFTDFYATTFNEKTNRFFAILCFA